MLCLTYEQRDAEQRVASRTARLMAVYRAAKTFAEGMRRLGPREYECDPGSMLALRTALAEAGLELLRERKRDK